MATQNKVAWVSLNPNEKKIDFYPRSIAAKIEKEYKNYILSSRQGNNFCMLGSDFLNATVYFPQSFNSEMQFYQRTPGVSLGRGHFKRPGYRSVMRLDVSLDNTYTIYTKTYNKEPRIIFDALLSECDYKGTVPEDNIINIDYLAEIPEVIQSWNPNDLLGEYLDKNVIVWMWCVGTQENQGDLMKLSDEWWKPYFYEQNTEIENAFQESIGLNASVKIKIPTTDMVKEIRFVPNFAFAKQIDCNSGGIRQVKRVTMTVKQLKKKLENIHNIPIDIATLAAQVLDDNIPYEYICSISQSIMTDPVKTIDGMIYDRKSIEQWFQYRYTSPLTGLELSNITLTPYTELKINIEEYLKLKYAQSQENNVVV